MALYRHGAGYSSRAARMAYGTGSHAAGADAAGKDTAAAGTCTGAIVGAREPWPGTCWQHTLRVVRQQWHNAAAPSLACTCITRPTPIPT